ncbi:MAG TPA: DUF1801 domain-containing protein [Candidatus Polarisedimenticolia bacterium]|nr:DUF1801 domain-containing protein [Candidatus Polarisedimenticolia bacterium]
MAGKAPGRERKEKSDPASEDVEAFLASLRHPAKPVILAVRETILAADSKIAEGIKWKVPSFRTSEYFATLNLRPGQGLRVILHLGAKKRDLPKEGLGIADPESLLSWLAEDRAIVAFKDLEDFSAKRKAFARLIQKWIQHVQ